MKPSIHLLLIITTIGILTTGYWMITQGITAVILIGLISATSLAWMSMGTRKLKLIVLKNFSKKRF